MSNLIEGVVHHASGGMLEPITRIIGTGGNLVMPYRFPEPDDFIEAFLKGLITNEKLIPCMRLHGFDLEDFTRDDLTITSWDENKNLVLNERYMNSKKKMNDLLFHNRIWGPDEEQILLWLRRGWINEDLARVWLMRLGVQEPHLRTTILKQIDEFPTVQDLIHFSVRHGFEPDILKTFGYAQEIPKTYLDWAKKIGLGGSSKVQVTDTTDENSNPLPDHEATWAEQHWFSHWILPSLGDAYEMLHRLYPKSDFGPSPDWKKDLDFTPDLLALFQRAQDIPKYWRERLQAISFLPFSRIDVRRMFNENVIEKEEVYHSYRAQGYNDDKAKKLLKYAQVAKQKQIEKEELWPKASKVCELFRIGILDDKQILKYLKQLGIPDAETQTFIDNCNLEGKLDLIKTALKALHRAYVKGVIEPDVLKKQLIDLGISDSAITSLLNKWTIEKGLEFREDNAGEARKWYEQGIITKDEFIKRLQNIGILPTAVLRMVASANFTISERILKEEIKLAKEIQANAKEAAREAKAAVKEGVAKEKDIIRRMLASSTQVNLKKWYKEGLISDIEISERLAALNYGPNDIQRWLVSYAPEG